MVPPPPPPPPRFVPEIISPLPCSPALDRHTLLIVYFFKELSFIGSLNKCHTSVFNALILFRNNEMLFQGIAFRFLRFCFLEIAFRFYDSVLSFLEIASFRFLKTASFRFLEMASFRFFDIKACVDSMTRTGLHMKSSKIPSLMLEER